MSIETKPSAEDGAGVAAGAAPETGTAGTGTAETGAAESQSAESKSAKPVTAETATAETKTAEPEGPRSEPIEVAAVRAVFSKPFARHQAAVVRIGVAFTFFAFLVREWPHRRILWGDQTAWSLDLARQMLANNHAFTVLAWSDSRAWFELVYALAIVVSALLMVGWRTRLTSVLFLLLVLSIENRATLLGDGGDNVIHLMAIYLAFTRCGSVWSLDARRAAKPRGAAASRSDLVGPVLWLAAGAALFLSQATGFATLGMLDFSLYSWASFLWLYWVLVGVDHWLRSRRPLSEGAAASEAVGNLLHNAAMLVIAAQVCLIYSTAGWYKIQGSLWQNGTAVYYPLHLQYFAPWPFLADLMSRNSTLILLLTYGTVIVQVSFPFLVFNRRIKNVLLVLMITEHLSIAFALGLPFFSLAMISADLVFLPTTFLRRLEQPARSTFARLPRVGRPADTVTEGAATEGTATDGTVTGGIVPDGTPQAVHP